MGVSRKQSTPKFPKNKHFLPPDTHTYAYQEVRNVCFSEILACFAFLKHPFWDSPFCFITDYFSVVLSLILIQVITVEKKYSSGIFNVNFKYIPQTTLRKILKFHLISWFSSSRPDPGGRKNVNFNFGFHTSQH